MKQAKTIREIMEVAKETGEELTKLYEKIVGFKDEKDLFQSSIGFASMLRRLVGNGNTMVLKKLTDKHNSRDMLFVCLIMFTLHENMLMEILQNNPQLVEYITKEVEGK